MLCSIDLTYECGCVIPMSINPDREDSDEKKVKINSYWAFNSKICKKHSEKAIYRGRHWIELGL